MMFLCPPLVLQGSAGFCRLFCVEGSAVCQTGVDALSPKTGRRCCPVLTSNSGRGSTQEWGHLAIDLLRDLQRVKESFQEISM